MLKALSSSVFSGLANAKCAEIYCHSSKSFTILCTLCEMKTFDYDDFLLHFQNIHFENDLLKVEEVSVECTPYLEVNLKCEELPTEDEDAGWMEAPVMAEAESDAEEELGQRLMKWQSRGAALGAVEGNTGFSDNQQNEEPGDGRNEDYKPPPNCFDETTNKEPKKKQEHKCDYCDKVYKSTANLKAHITREHKSVDLSTAAPQQAQKCAECLQEFPTQRGLERHSLAEHNGVKCAHCGKRFTSLLNMMRHAELHTRGDVKPFACDFQECTKRFFTLRQLQSHKRSHSGIKNYVCDVCGYSCREPETLRVHCRTHTGEKPFACQQCDRRFVSASALSEHKASHSTERPYMCAVCGCTFGRQKALYHHKFLHLGIKKFKCKICGNAYAQSSGLAGHMRKHREQGMC